MKLTLNHKNFGAIRIAGSQIEPLFCLNDICKALDMQNPAHLKNAITREFELHTLNVYSFNTPYGVKDFTMINESQLYFVLMRSDKPNAKIFRKWIVNEVLPSIRKTGRYVMNEKNTISNAIQIALTLQKAIDKVRKCNQKIIKTQKQLEIDKRNQKLAIEQFETINKQWIDFSQNENAEKSENFKETDIIEAQVSEINEETKESDESNTKNQAKGNIFSSAFNKINGGVK